MVDLRGKICIVTGASRGVGKGVVQGRIRFGCRAEVAGVEIPQFQGLQVRGQVRARAPVW